MTKQNFGEIGWQKKSTVVVFNNWIQAQNKKYNCAKTLQYKYVMLVVNISLVNRWFIIINMIII